MIRVIVVCNACGRAEQFSTVSDGSDAARLAARKGFPGWIVAEPPNGPEEHYCGACTDRRAGLAMLAQLVDDLRDDDDNAGSDDDP